VPPQILTVPEMAARLGISRFALYLRIKKGTVPAFRALYRTGPCRFLVGAGEVVRPLPHFHRRRAEHVPLNTPDQVARTLRISTRVVLAACAAEQIECQRSPGARVRGRFRVGIDPITLLPLPVGTVLGGDTGPASTKRR